MKRYTIILLFLCFATHVGANTYTLYVGRSQTFSCPSPPSGAAIYKTKWASRHSNVSVRQDGTFSAEITATEYFTDLASVQCDYYYYWDDMYGRQHQSSATTFYTFKCFQVSILPNRTSLSLDRYDTGYITYTISPSNVSPKPSVNFISNNTNVITVNNDGYYKAVGEGSTTITLTNSMGKDATVSVKVIIPDEQKQPTSISIPSTTDVYLGDTKEIKYSLYPAGSHSALTWKSDNEAVATVNQNGYVTGNGEGTCNVTVKTTNNLTSTTAVKVTRLLPTSVKIGQTSNKLYVGAEYRLSYTLIPEKAKATVTWTSSDKCISVDEEGKIKAIQPGTAILTAEADNGVKATTKITVPELPTSVVLPEENTMVIGSSMAIQPVFQPYGTGAITYWSSDSPDIVEVHADGMAYAKSIGTATISCVTSNGIQKTIDLKVVNAGYSLEFWTKDYTIRQFSFAEKPTVAYGDKSLIVKSHSDELEIPLDNFRKFLISESFENKYNVAAIDDRDYQVNTLVSPWTDYEFCDNYKKLDVKENVEKVNVSYSRTFNSTQWQGWYVPFDLTLTADILENFAFAMIDGAFYSADDVPYLAFVHMDEGKVVRANTPYVVKALYADAENEQYISTNEVTLKKTEERGFTINSSRHIFTFKGLYNQIESSTEESLYLLHSNGIFQKPYEDELLNPFRFIMSIETRTDTPYEVGELPKEVKIIIDDDITSIDQMSSGDERTRIYRLDGIEIPSNKIEKIKSGIYIQNGKKIIK